MPGTDRFFGWCASPSYMFRLPAGTTPRGTIISPMEPTNISLNITRAILQDFDN